MSDWHTKYQSICDPDAERFIWQGLAYAVELYGEPLLAVRRVRLCHSIPLDRSPSLKRDFQLTEIVDEASGDLAIYLPSASTEYRFHGQLAHEVAHLLNAKLFDVYVEGLNTVFAEKLLKKLGHDWSGWERHYAAGNEPYYARTYAMMTEVCRVAGGDQMRRFLSHAVATPGRPGRMEICIDNWLAGLCPAERGEICSIIARYYPSISLENARRNPPDAFGVPVVLLA